MAEGMVPYSASKRVETMATCSVEMMGETWAAEMAACWAFC